MPMTKRQLEQIEKDYNGLVPPTWQVVGCHDSSLNRSEERADVGCAFCGDPLIDEWGNLKTAKRITFRPNARLELTALSILCCRNGVKCRERVQKRHAAHAGISGHGLRVAS